MLEGLLSCNDQGRAQRVIQKLARHDVHSWVLTGGFAVEIHHLIRGADPILRTLNDIDFVASSFDCLPEVHPLDPPGKTMLQAVDADEAVRIDVFNDGGVASGRAQPIVLSGWETQMISVEDLLARMARSSLDIGQGETVPAKPVRDFLRLGRSPAGKPSGYVSKGSRAATRLGSEPTGATDYANVRDCLRRLQTL